MLFPELTCCELSFILPDILRWVMFEAGGVLLIGWVENENKVQTFSHLVARRLRILLTLNLDGKGLFAFSFMSIREKAIHSSVGIMLTCKTLVQDKFTLLFHPDKCSKIFQRKRPIIV